MGNLTFTLMPARAAAQRQAELRSRARTRISEGSDEAVADIPDSQLLEGIITAYRRNFAHEVERIAAELVRRIGARRADEPLQ